MFLNFNFLRPSSRLLSELHKLSDTLKRILRLCLKAMYNLLRLGTGPRVILLRPRDGTDTPLTYCNSLVIPRSLETKILKIEQIKTNPNR